MDQYEKLLPGFKGQVEKIVSNPIRWKAAIEDAQKQIKLLKDELRRRNEEKNFVDSVSQKEGNGNSQTPLSWKGKARLMGAPVIQKVLDKQTKITRKINSSLSSSSS